MKKILIVKLASMGDVIASSPHAVGIKSSNSECRVHLLTMDHMKPCAQLLDGYSYIHFVPSKFSILGLFSTLKIFFRILFEGYNEVYNFHRNFYISFFLRLCNTGRVFSYKSHKIVRFFEIGLVEFSPFKNRTLQECEIIQRSGTHIKFPVRLFLKSPMCSGFEATLEGDYICVSLGGGNIHSDARSRIWPILSYVSVIKALPGKIVLVGAGEADQILADIVLKNVGDSDRVISLVNRCSLAQTASIIRSSKLFVGNDSGLAYVSAAVGAKTLVLFGPTPVSAALPLGKNVFHLTEKVACSPCYDPRDGLDGTMYKCTSNMCMQSLSIEKVLAKVRELVA